MTGPATGPADRAWWPILLAVAGLILWFATWTIDRPRGYPDTFDYTSIALQIRGTDRVTADREAIRFALRWAQPGVIEAAYRIYPRNYLQGNFEPTRYRGIFEERPLYPVIGAVFMTMLGLNGMIVASALGVIVFSLALGSVVAMGTSSRVLALAAVVLAFVLPLGVWLMPLIAEGWMLALWAACLGLATRYLRRPAWPWLAAFGGCALLLVLTKSTNAAALALTVGAVGILALAMHHPSAGALLRLTLVASAVLAAFAVVTALLGLPNFTDATNDLLTFHYTQPAPASPLRALVHLSLYRMPRILHDAQLILWLVLALAAIPLVLVRRLSSWLWIMGAAASMLLFAAHPEPSEGPRYLAPVWISVVVGLSLWPGTLERLGLRLPQRLRSAAVTDIGTRVP